MKTTSNNLDGINGTICGKCETPYEQVCIEQEPGSGERDYDVCPNCGHINGSSTVVMFCNKK